MENVRKYSLAQGKELVGIAREQIDALVKERPFMLFEDVLENYQELSGCFVTLNFDSHLRGCIGYPEPAFPLWQAIRRSAIAAASEDPRFMPVTNEELDNITVEVNVLTTPVELIAKDVAELLTKIVVGRDGLIIQKGRKRGLLLPSVPVVENWDVDIYLAHLCLKANLRVEAWKNLDEVRLWTFQSQIFEEKTPRGEIVELIL